MYVCSAPRMQSIPCKSLQGIFGEAAFAKMKRGARVVNVARGGVIDDAALARALDQGIVAQAALDVFTKVRPAVLARLLESNSAGYGTGICYHIRT